MEGKTRKEKTKMKCGDYAHVTDPANTSGYAMFLTFRMPQFPQN